MKPINTGTNLFQNHLSIFFSRLNSRNSQRSRRDTSSRTSRSSHHTHSRDINNEPSSNDTNFDNKNKKRKHHHSDNSNYSPKRHHRSSPLPSYPMSIHPSRPYHRRSRYHRKSSTSSTHSSEHSLTNDIDQYQRSTKGTLASELDKLRPKVNKTKTVTTNEQPSKNDNDVRISNK
jgi:hypothetical protein